MDSGSESIQDAKELARVRQQAMKVHAQALATAAVLTVITMLIP